jgi:hypothetical protein
MLKMIHSVVFNPALILLGDTEIQLEGCALISVHLISMEMTQQVKEYVLRDVLVFLIDMLT